MSLYLLELYSSGGDLACRDCLLIARADHAGSIRYVTQVVAEGENCAYCGIPSEEHGGRQ